MVTCGRCGRDNRDEALYCRHCGAPLALKCPRCGNANPADAAFCDRCGTALTAGAEPGERAGGGAGPLAAPGAAASGAAGEGPAAPGGYTPSHLRRLFAGADALRGERKEVVVLFADVSGFTSLSETLDPETVHEVMNGCFDILTSEVHRFGGTVNQYTGDGVMALFGAPRALESAPRDSIRAALAIQERLRGYAGELERARGISFHLRMGLNAGEVVVGAIGDELRMDYTAMGDTTNTAARLQAAAAPGEVLVSEPLFRLTREWFRFEDLGRGRVNSRIEAAALRGLLRLREREDVLASLLRIYGEVEEGRGQIVALSGEAGMGKSRLFYEFRESLKRRETPPLCVSASAVHYDRNAPLSLLRRLLRAYAAAAGVYCPVEGTDDEGLWQEALRTRAGQLLGGEEAAAVGALLQPGQADPPTAPGGAARDPRAGFEALRNLLVRESQERPVVVAVENMRDVGPSSLAFLDMLAAASASAPVMFVPVHRPGFEHPWGMRRNFNQISLRPLSRKATEAMIAELLGGEAAADLIEAVHARARGNPFFIEELVRGMKEGGSIVSGGGRWRLRQAGEVFELPRTIQDVVLSRLDALPARLREVLQRASVIGPRFHFDLLQRVCPDVADLEEALARLQDLDLVYAAEGDPAGAWGFVNRLIQELAYREMLRSRRAALHERVAAAIESEGPAAIAQNLDRLAYHYQRSDALEKAAHYLIRAGRRAYAMLALPQAATRLEQGLIHLESLGEDSARFLAERIHVRGDLALALLGLGGDERRIESLLAEMRGMAEEAGDWAQVAMAHVHMCTLRFRQGNQEAVVACARRAIETAGRAGAHEPLFRAHFALSSAYRLLGRSREAIAEGEAAVEIYETHLRRGDASEGDLRNVFVETLAALGAVHANLGEVAEAEACLERAEREARTTPGMAAGGIVAFFRTGLFLARAQWAELAEGMEDLRRKMEGMEFPLAQSGVALHLGLARIHLGQVAEGLALVEDATRERLRIEQRLMLAAAHLARAEGLWRLGRAEEAREACREAIRQAGERGECLVAALAGEMLARITCEAAAGDERADALAAYERALERLEELGLRPALARGRKRLAGFLRRGGEAARAEALEAQARAFLRGIGARDADEAPALSAGGA